MASPSNSADTSLFNNPTLSDVKIRQIYKGKVTEYFAHKAVLCAHSKWFLKAFTGKFKEASEQTIEVLDDDPKKFELMLKFVYTMDLPTPSRSSSCHIEALVEHNIMVPIGVHILADKYEITPLLHYTCDQVARAMRIHGKSLEADHIAAIVAAYYDSCSRAQSTMGITIAQGIDKHVGSWISRSQMHPDTSFDSMVKKYGFFAADLVLALKSAGRLDFGR
ncbi:unnamed protein product [Alternaria sp. RS040]